MKHKILPIIFIFVTMFSVAFLSFKCINLQKELNTITLKVTRCDDTVMAIGRLQDRKVFNFKRGCRCVLKYKGKAFISMDTIPGTCEQIVTPQPTTNKKGIDI